MSQQAVIFDNALKTAQRSRAARGSAYDDVLHREVANRLVDRLKDCTKTFENVLIVGGAGVNVARALLQNAVSVNRITYADACEEHLRAFDALAADENDVELRSIRTSEEALEEGLRAAAGGGGEEGGGGSDGPAFDVAISCLALHWVNDLPSALGQIRKSLKPDGLFLGALLGGDTISELRIACSIAEMEREGGVSPRVSPMARLRDAGSLMSASGFGLPVVDIDTIQIRYPHAFAVVQHLREMGESNANVGRRGVLSRDTALAALAVFQSMGELRTDGGGEGGQGGQGGEGGEGERGDENMAPGVTYQVIYLGGWAPDPSQQRPKDRGAASMSMRSISEL